MPLDGKDTIMQWKNYQNICMKNKTFAT